MTTVGAHQAKTHLAGLLERVQAGESVIITRHGKEVALLVPPPGIVAGQGDLNAMAAEWRKTRAAGVKLRGLKVRDLISEGRTPYSAPPRRRRLSSPKISKAGIH